jgi:hypothetical protein
VSNERVMNEEGKRRGIFYGITKTFAWRERANLPLGQPNNLDQTRDLQNKKGHSNQYVATLRFM